MKQHTKDKYFCICVRQAKGGEASREATDQRVARSHADPAGDTPKKLLILIPDPIESL
jgi:hypothetical protein